MSNGRNANSKSDSGRDGTTFVALPWVVLDSAAYQSLSHAARGLLIEIARQFKGDNNGKLLASAAYLKTRGWNSSDVIARAKRDLIKVELIFETVKGHRPNKASWYALTWRRLDKFPGYDPGATACFQRGAYHRGTPLKNLLTPSPGLGRPPIASSPGTVVVSSTSPAGAINLTFDLLPTPPHGHHLEMPSVGAGHATH
jgi:hypothetical protein